MNDLIPLIEILSEEFLDSWVQAQYQGEGTYAILNPADSAQIREDAACCLKENLMAYYLQLSFKPPDQVRMEVYLRHPTRDMYSAQYALKRSFEIIPAQKKLYIKGLKFNGTETNLILTYNFISPRILSLSLIEGPSVLQPPCTLIFYKN